MLLSVFFLTIPRPTRTTRTYTLVPTRRSSDLLGRRAEVALSTSKSDFPNFSTTLDFINPNGPQPVIGRSIDNGVPLEFDLRNGTLQFGIDQASPFAPT